jgi:hypothetical protein
MTKNQKKIYSSKKLYFFDKKIAKNRPPERAHKLQEKPSALKKEHPEL